MNSKIREAAQIILSETDSKWFVELDSAEKLSNLKDALIERGFEDEAIGANEEWLQSEIESYFAEAKAGFRGHKTVAPYSDLFVYPVNYVPSEINVGDSVTVNSPSRYLAPGVEMINIPAVVVGIDSDGRYLLECDSAVWPEWGNEALPFQRAEINPADAN